MKAPHQLELDALSNANQSAMMTAVGAARANEVAYAVPAGRLLAVETVVLAAMGIGCAGYLLAWAFGA